MDLGVDGCDLCKVKEEIRVKVILETYFTEQTAYRFKQLESRLTKQNEEHPAFNSVHLRPKRASVTTVEYT